MRIWVDADACPNPVKEILFRAADRRHVETTLVANHQIRVPPSRYLKSLQVPSGFDEADDAIVARVGSGDLVITADIPLAGLIVEAGGTALNPRGILYTAENIKDHLARRDLLDELRSTGAIVGGPATLSKTDVQEFANQLDRFLTRAASKSS
jgi:uncharacterized protein YaiI (UPF0178 family)